MLKEIKKKDMNIVKLNSLVPNLSDNLILMESQFVRDVEVNRS